LSLKNLTKDQLQPIVDRIADQLPGWKSDLMTRAGRRVQVQYMLIGMLIYLAMAVNIPLGLSRLSTNLEKGFLWRGVQGGQRRALFGCLGQSCRPLQLGGLGISSLKELSWALRMRWLWLQKTEPNRPWCSLPIQVRDKARAFFLVVLISKVGNGTNTLF
jgi:hypothetical protein